MGKPNSRAPFERDIEKIEPEKTGEIVLCVCVWEVKDQREFGNKCVKGKGKDGERHLLLSVIKSSSAFVQK